MATQNDALSKKVSEEKVGKTVTKEIKKEIPKEIVQATELQIHNVRRGLTPDGKERK